jgi:hypothetical protein
LVGLDAGVGANLHPPIGRDTAWAMSQKNVEIVRRIFTTINDGLDYPRELLDPDFELDLSETAGGVHHGIDAMLE